MNDGTPTFQKAMASKNSKVREGREREKVRVRSLPKQGGTKVPDVTTMLSPADDSAENIYALGLILQRTKATDRRVGSASHLRHSSIDLAMRR